MAMTTSATRELQNEYINRKFLEQLKPELCFFKFATEGQVPAGMGDTIRWLHFPEFDVDTSALSETTASDNEISSYAATSGTGTISPYGQFLKISEQHAKTAVGGFLDQISQRLTFLGAKTVDTLLRDAAYGATNTFKEGQVARNTGNLVSTNTLRASTFAYVAAELISGGNQTFSNGQFEAVLHPVQTAQLKAEPSTSSGLPTWSELNKYVQNAQAKTAKGEAGSIMNVHLNETPLITRVGVETSGTAGASANCSGYRGVVLAVDAVGRAGIGDMDPRIIIKQPSKNDTSQPLDTYWTYGVKFRAAHKLLSNERCVILYSA